MARQTFFCSFFVSFLPSFVNSGGGTGTAGAWIDEAALCAASTSGSRNFEGPAPRVSGSVIYGAGRELVSNGGSGLMCLAQSILAFAKEVDNLNALFFLSVVFVI